MREGSRPGLLMTFRIFFFCACWNTQDLAFLFLHITLNLETVLSEIDHFFVSKCLSWPDGGQVFAANQQKLFPEKKMDALVEVSNITLISGV